MHSNRWGRLALMLSAGLFVASLFPDTFAFGWPGWGALRMGWMEVGALPDVGPFVAFAWFANPRLTATWVLIWRGVRNSAAACAAFALVLGGLLLLRHDVLYSASGAASPLEYGVGY